MLLLLTAMMSKAAEITYRIDTYNADICEYILSAFGERPAGACAFFTNEYGETAGNRYNQIPRNRKATLYLEGWAGCTIKSITFSMCSNNKAGTVGFSIKDGDDTLFSMSPVEFCSPEWFGEWVSKDLGTYVDVKKEFNIPAFISDETEIELKAGTKEGSVYIKSITIEYDAPENVALESPLGYVFEKMEAKGKLAEGDVIMLYRSGNAAADLGGMEESKYLDALGINSTSNVTEPDVALFTLTHDDSHNHWTLTNQYGQQLGATSAQSLAWDEGIRTWDITLGYNGATIASTNSKYGTIRFNAPSGYYARFWNYTSTSLTLPYIYRRVRQLSPIVSTGLTLNCDQRTAELGAQDTLILKATFYPTNTTDTRIIWQSSNPQVATVNSGIIHPLSEGTTTITATAADGGATTSMLLTVTSASCIPRLTHSQQTSPTFSTDGTPVIPYRRRGIVISNGKKVLK